MLRCSFCGQYPTIKSNKAIHEELSRFWKPFDTIAIPTCPNQDCPNHQIDREHYLLSVTKLLRIFQSVKHLPVAEDFFQKEKDR
jgi:hypothetical protein